MIYIVSEYASQGEIFGKFHLLLYLKLMVVVDDDDTETGQNNNIPYFQITLPNMEECPKMQHVISFGKFYLPLNTATTEVSSTEI